MIAVCLKVMNQVKRLVNQLKQELITVNCPILTRRKFGKLRKNTENVQILFRFLKYRLLLLKKLILLMQIQLNRVERMIRNN